MMSTRLSAKRALLTVALLLATGCAQYSLKEFAPINNGPKSALIDIKQRAILTGSRVEGTTTTLVTCAEPSPDALSSLTSELALDTKFKDTVQASLGYSQQEAASFVGLRTQTIQLLRDGMYRLCEGYLSGALSSADYAWLSRRYQRNMVALLTIEQLTRVAQAPAVAQFSQGMASAARSATAIAGDIEEIDKAKARLADEKTKIEAEKIEADKLPDGDAKTAKQKDVQKRIDEKQAAITRADEVRSALLEGLKSAKGILVSGTTTVQVVGGTPDTRGSAGTEVVKAISDITQQILNQDDLPTLCFQLIDGSRKANGASPELKTSCAALIAARAEQETATIQKKREQRSSADDASDVPDVSFRPVLVPLTSKPMPEFNFFGSPWGKGESDPKSRQTPGKPK